MARVRRELIRSPSQKGAGGGCIDPTVELRATAPTVNPVEGALFGLCVLQR
jgi:hypothetical protein